MPATKHGLWPSWAHFRNDLFIACYPFAVQEPKQRAALLLRTLLVLAEDAVHQHLQHLVPAFCK